MKEKQDFNLKNEKNFYHKLLTECHKKGKSINQIERDLGYPRNALHNYKGGTQPSGERLIELADYFDISPKYLIGIDETETSHLIRDFFQGLDTDEKREMSHLCHKWLMTLVRD